MRGRLFLQLIKINWQQILSLECRLQTRARSICAAHIDPLRFVLFCCSAGEYQTGETCLCPLISPRERKQTAALGRLQPVLASRRTCKRSSIPLTPTPTPTPLVLRCCLHCQSENLELRAYPCIFAPSATHF